ncbi:uncharacterized protein BO97DRAFT_439880 [Aspergillus homomorphus CBS 101889]|uniref:Uncharacterized protein n=1 Tax=Aspergillus homomorphus (strain CBS 101889) TaxID=1450537 RepID=A0A395IAX6_ASPHC|nr:hypothetical protein BO97DRAFT_439880 [Aspergillus homomorphus CBS 101889]RAL16969.1 hypothetical protein BO97DRAFT_439880 [Aspergillus homomorphus CBS 101889]
MLDRLPALLTERHHHLHRYLKVVQLLAHLKTTKKEQLTYTIENDQDRSSTCLPGLFCSPYLRYLELNSRRHALPHEFSHVSSAYTAGSDMAAASAIYYVCRRIQGVSSRSSPGPDLHHQPTSTNTTKPFRSSKLLGPPHYQQHMQKLSEGSKHRSESARRMVPPIRLLNPHPHHITYPAANAAMLSTLIQQVRDEARQRLGHAIDITMLTIPREIDSLASNHLMQMVIASNATFIDYRWVIRDIPRDTWLAYQQDTCAALRTSQALDCDLMNEVAVMLFVDHGLGGVLNLWAAEVGEYNIWTDAEGQHREDTAEDIRRALDEFINEGIIVPGEAQGVRAIIVSGDESDPEIEMLKQALCRVLPEDWRPLVQDQVDPLCVGAVGAARRAKM